MAPGNDRPFVIVIVGGNGAGKSTFYRTRIAPLGVPFINADEIAREFWPEDPEQHSYDAMLLAEQSRTEALERGLSHCFETVFSHPSKIDFLVAAKDRGFEVNLYVIHVANVEFNVERVRQRVLEGGHSVPEDKIRSRLPRTMEHIKQAIPLCDRVALLDNSYVDQPFMIQAQYDGTAWRRKAEPMAQWAQDIVCVPLHED